MKIKKIFEFLIHILFWVITTYVFINNSFLRSPSFSLYEEIFSVFFVFVIVYFNYYFLIIKYFNKRKFAYYFIIILSCLLIISLIEFLFIKDDVLKGISTDNETFKTYALGWNLFGIFFRDALFVGFFTMFKIYRDAIKSYKLLKEKSELEISNYINQVEMVKSKVNVHFLLNTLQCIHSLALKKSDHTADGILNLTLLMKYIVAETDDVLVSLKKEISFLQHYIELEKLKKPDLKINFEVDGEVDEFLLPPMILESFVNNAFKYNDYLSGGLIDVRISCLGKDILFTCRNAVNKSLTQNIYSTKKGIENTKNRLELHYKDLHKLVIDENEKYYFVSLLLKSRL